MVMKNRELKAATEEDSDSANSSTSSDEKPVHSESGDDSYTSSSDEEVPSTPRPLSTTDDKLAAEEEYESESPTAAQRKATMPAAESAPKPLDNVSNLKTQKSNQNPKPKPKPVVVAAEATVKRALPLDDAEESESKSKKKAKKEEVEGRAAEEEEEEGKKLLHRLWGEDDEIALLQGIVDYKEEKGTDPMADKGDFYDFVKESLHVDVDKKQVAEKVRKLKRRHLNNLNKKSLTPHEEKAGKISKLIWGAAVVDQQTTRANNKDSGMANTNTDNELLFIGKGCVKIMGLDEDVVKLGLELCTDQSKREIEEEWKQLFLEEAALSSKKLKLAWKESNLVTDALNARWAK